MSGPTKRYWNDESYRDDKYDDVRNVKRMMKHGTDETMQRLESNSSRFDAGLIYNQERCEHIYEPGDLVHYHSTAPNGLRVHIEKRAANLSPRNEILYRVAYGPNPSMPSQLMTRDEAVNDLREHGIEL